MVVEKHTVKVYVYEVIILVVLKPIGCGTGWNSLDIFITEESVHSTSFSILLSVANCCYSYWLRSMCNAGRSLTSLCRRDHNCYAFWS